MLVVFVDAVVVTFLAELVLLLEDAMFVLAELLVAAAALALVEADFSLFLWLCLTTCELDASWVLCDVVVELPTAQPPRPSASKITSELFKTFLLIFIVIALPPATLILTLLFPFNIYIVT